MTVLPYDASTYSKSWVAYGLAEALESSMQITHADGWRCFDARGTGYVDCVMGLGSSILGHRNHRVDTAIRGAVARGLTFSLGHPSEIDAAELLLKHFPPGCMVQWGVNGSDATEGACRLARAVTGKQWIAIAEDGYHGFHDWALTMTPRGFGTPYTAQLCRFDNIEEVTPDLGFAAVIIEPDLHPDWLKPLRAWCNKSGALLIADEVMCWQRYPEGTGSAHYGVEPDIWCLGKTLGNGMPVSAIVGNESILGRFAPGDKPNAFFSSTWAGHPLSMAAVIATLEEMAEKDGANRVWKKSQTIYEFLHNADFGGLITDFGEPPFNRIRFKNVAVARAWRRLMREAGCRIYSGHFLSLAHDDNAMQRIVDAWQYVTKNANQLAAVADQEDAGTGVMRR